VSDALALTAIAAATAVATGIGAIPVALLGTRAAALQPGLGGLAAGVMAVAAVVGLAIPAFRQGSAAVVAPCLLGGAFALVLVRRRLSAHHRAALSLADERSLLVFGVLFAHSFPEGLAIGSAYASTTADLGAFVIAAIAIQNVPEGTAVAIPLREAGRSASAQIFAAVLTSAPQIPGALIAWVAVDQVRSLLPASFALAGGAMLALVLVDTLPDAWSRGQPAQALAGFAVGAGVMLAVSALLGI
jgi:zinc transporter, ZIP family